MNPSDLKNGEHMAICLADQLVRFVATACMADLETFVAFMRSAQRQTTPIENAFFEAAIRVAKEAK